ncbi:MAG: arsenosugar biosynthesis radical SAM protein ArsS [SAR324 cluster bacterium]|nr:arsenosugar biosynthesis radical SAM protein ArsS [SAR324 cluster bacterium]
MNQPTTFANDLFAAKLDEHSLDIKRTATQTLQVNLGRLCNQTCNHCHQGAGPARKEVMEKVTMLEILTLLDKTPRITTVDLTGGAPEMNPHFRFFVGALKERNLSIINRCNLTVLFEKGQETTAQFFADMGLRIVASMPCYSQKNVDQQRGDGVYASSIKGLKLLNSLGYGDKLTLDLVYNPGGAFLPGDQAGLEADYKKRLFEDHTVTFSSLLTITNMPIRRFSGFLKSDHHFDEYLDLLNTNFNPTAALGIMCRDMVSVDYRGRVYDCDFNQAMDFGNKEKDLKDLTNFEMAGDAIAFGEHCFGCTAGSGSSCGGALAGEK